MAFFYPTLIPGTAKTWKNTAGDYVLTLTSLTSANAREGDKGDLYDATNARYPRVLGIFLTSAVGTTVASDGLSLDLYFAESTSATAGTSNPGGLTGADSGRGGTLRNQLRFAGSLPFLTGLTTGAQSVFIPYWPTQRYLVPYLYNGSGQTLSGTAGNHSLVITPYYDIGSY